MKRILSFCILLVTLCIASSVQSWEVYNRSTAADSELLDGLDSTAFTLQSTFNTYTAISFTPLSAFSSYTSTAVGGGGSPFDNITVTGVAVINKITGGVSSQNTGLDSVVLGGINNTCSGLQSFCGNGINNTASATKSTILNGDTGIATATHATILGGHLNVNNGAYSLIYGRQGVLSTDADRTVAFVYDTSDINITTPNAHIIYGGSGFEKKVGIQVLNPDDTLDVDGTAQITGNVTLDSGILFTGMVTTYDNYSVGIGDYTVFAHATSSTKDMYLPDATTVDGMHLRFKKKDATSNHITINATGAQTIDGNGSKVLEQTNNAITLYSNGSNWEVLQATSVAHFGEMHVHDNSTATDISTANSPHLIQGLFAEEDTDGFTFVAGSTGPISAFTEYSTVVSGTTKVTDVDHGLSSGAIISISGTTSYNDVFEVTVIDSANYYITDTFVDDDATGNWYEGDNIVNATGKTGKYRVEFHGFGTPQTNNDILEFHIYKDAIEMASLESKRKFTSSTDVGAVSASGLITIADGEAITFSIINTSGVGNFTMAHVNVVIHSF